VLGAELGIRRHPRTDGEAVIRAGLVLIVLAAAASSAPPQPGTVRRGMTPEEVKAVLGPPRRVSRQLLFRRHLEQWQYDEPPRTVEINCVRGEEPYVLQLRS